ncbi:ABC transporter substrate-binding protein [Paenibacillus alkalitolerans]|uniref:ABC transporter substrate-binding protein n=1 Tax=Paenibacillus alkalitolerans TaxID=2799335 RepID=UPI0018F72566|nr:ABC transporter substrate-binding protein [Paenibacillus alkalitolerans]
MKKRICLTLSITLAVLIVLSACAKAGETSGSTAGSGGAAPIKLALSPWPGWFFWYVVEEKGYFKKHGVDVELTWFPVYSDSLQALSTGQVDANSQTLSDTLAPLSKGIKLKAVLINDNSNGGDAIVSKPEIKTVPDLKGKTVATELGTVDHLLLLTALDQHGMKESDINFVNMAVNDAGPAFITGKVDASVLWEPFQTKAVQEGKGRVLFSSKETPGLIPDLLVFKEEVVKNRPDDVQKIVDAWFDALADFQKNPEEGLAIMAEKAETSIEDYKLGMESIKLFSPEENVKAFESGEEYTSLVFTGQKTAEFLKKLDMIGSIPNVEELLEPSFVQKAAER